MGSGASAQRAVEGIVHTTEIPGTTGFCDDEGNTMSPIYRTPKHPDAPPLEEIKTLYDVFKRGCHFGSTRPFLGRRKRAADGHLLEEFEWWTYGEVEVLAQLLGSALLRLKLIEYADFPEEAYPAARRLRCIGICSKNRVEWFVTDLAATCYKATVVPLYDTLGDEAIEYMLITSKLSCVAGAAENLEHLLSVLKGSSTHFVKSLICFDEITKKIRSEASEIGVTVYAYEDLFTHSREQGILPLELPSGENVATLCFTSGTMGRPKGVILTHGQFAAVLVGHVQGLFFQRGVNMHCNHCYLSYLPLAHVLEKKVVSLVIMHGARVPVYSGNPATLLDDIRLAQPTIFATVPRILMRIDDKIASGVAQKSGAAQSLFRTGLKTKLKGLRTQGQLTHKVWDALIFKKIQAVLGGQMELIVFAGAPLDKAIQERLACMLSCPILSGYGLSETGGGCVNSRADDGIYGHTGGPLPNAEARLVSVADMGYRVENNPPAGELWLRGVTITPGYFLDPEKTAEALTKDGWLRTGDIAIRMPEGGRMKIVDRKKNIFKLSQGEYVAPDRVEGVLAQALLVAQAFVYGDSTRDFIVAILCLDEEEVTATLQCATIPKVDAWA